MYLVSSNPKKLAEFARYGLALTLRQGEDLPEVQGTPLEVAIHKAKLAGPGAVVEDTVLVVNGKPWVDIKWTQDNLQNYVGDPVRWLVTLAHNTGKDIHVFVGEVEGLIVCPSSVRPEAFGFDPFVAPRGWGGQSLDDLEQQGKKDQVSARRRAVDALLLNAPEHVIRLDAVEEWKGDWQGSNPA